MTDCVAHRGPDGSGTAFFSRTGEDVAEPASGRNWKLAFGHRRLAILDVSDAGRQPMSYRDRFWITYNGEVFNFVELRKELSTLGHTFRSGSDTEVILAAFAEWDVQCFARFRGMWGLAIVDLARRRLVVCRDRLGIKPLYRFESDGVVYYASEIKQFAEVGPALRPNETALGEYLLTGYEPKQATFFERITAVPAGTWSEIDFERGTATPPQAYWRPESIDVAIFDRDQAAEAVRAALEESAVLHLRSDVPVGCALSGGLDSSSVAALLGNRRDLFATLNTFTVSFPGSSIDESRFAALVNQSARLQSHVVRPTAEDFLCDFDRFVWAHDEPVGSLSQYAGFALARLTRQAGVPVTLNGQGGDETLLGYWQSYFAFLFCRLRRGDVASVFTHVLGSILPGGNPELIRQLPVMWRRYRSRAAAAGRLRLPSLERRFGEAGRERIQQVLQLSPRERRISEIRDLHLPRLLKWDDRNLMAFSVEGRYPFLDHRFIETALTCDESSLYRRGWTKEPLRRGMSDLLPQELLRRRDKNGFETPQADWLCGPLRPEIETWLGGDSPLWTYVEPREVRSLAEHAWSSGGRDTETAQALMRMFIADRWLRVFFVAEPRSREMPIDLAT